MSSQPHSRPARCSRRSLGVVLSILLILLASALGMTSGGQQQQQSSNVPRASAAVGNAAAAAAEASAERYSRQALVLGESCVQKLRESGAVHLVVGEGGSEGVKEEVFKCLLLSGVGKLVRCGNSLGSSIVVASSSEVSHFPLAYLCFKKNPPASLCRYHRKRAGEEDTPVTARLGRTTPCLSGTK